jgi:hypothetical protein
MKRFKTLSTDEYKWRNFLRENGKSYADIENEGDMILEPSGVPQELYHATSLSFLSRVAENGLVDYSDMTRHGAGQMGISFTTEKELAYNGSFGELVLVLDGASLAGSGQYEFRQVQQPDAPDEGEIRVTMVDSAFGSGSGLDTSVDQLGTKIPFEPYVIRLVFPKGIQHFEAKWFKENYPDLEIEHLDREKGEIVNIDDSY